MSIIDSQVHAYEANTPKRPWRSVPNWPEHVTGDEMIAAMDKVGVDGAIFVSPFSMYGYDASYAVEVQQAHPDRFAIIKPVDPDNPDVADVVAPLQEAGGFGCGSLMPNDGAGIPIGGCHWAAAGTAVRSAAAVRTHKNRMPFSVRLDP